MAIHNREPVVVGPLQRLNADSRLLNTQLVPALHTSLYDASACSFTGRDYRCRLSRTLFPVTERGTPLLGVDRFGYRNWCVMRTGHRRCWASLYPSDLLVSNGWKATVYPSKRPSICNRILQPSLCSSRSRLKMSIKFYEWVRHALPEPVVRADVPNTPNWLSPTRLTSQGHAWEWIPVAVRSSCICECPPWANRTGPGIGLPPHAWARCSAERNLVS